MGDRMAHFYRFVTCYNIFTFALLSLLMMSTFMLKIKYNEFLMEHEKNISHAQAMISFCNNDYLREKGGVMFFELCDSLTITASGNAQHLALKDTICFVLPFMSVLDRKKTDSMVDVILENDKLIKIGLVIFVVYIIAWNTGILRFRSYNNNQYQQMMAMPYINPNVCVGVNHGDNMGHYQKNKVQ